MEQKPSGSKHAVVIGGSIAGLTTARILTDYFDHVTIIERDLFPETPDFRKGVPQGRQPHILLKRGQMILEELFPGFGQKMLEGGAQPLNMAGDSRWLSFGKWRPRFESSVQLLGSTRILIEHTVRTLLAANPKISFIQETEAIGLETTADGKQVAGVQLRKRPGAQTPDAGSFIAAEFVVDASGRESRAPQWLEALGYAAPQEIVVDAKPSYATRIYERNEDFSGDWNMMYIQPAAPQTRGAIMLPIEGGKKWHVTMMGLAGDYAPTDEESFMEFARSLPVPDAYEALKQMTPVSPVIGYRRAENRLRVYDQLPRYLEGFVLIGDSVFAFNPVYGQGMTTAAISAVELGSSLQERIAAGGDMTGFAEGFQKKLAQIIAFPWQLATGEDMRYYPELMPELDQETKLMQQYFEKVLLASCTNPNVMEVFLQVLTMVEAPTVFFRPDVVLQVVNEMAVANV